MTFVHKVAVLTSLVSFSALAADLEQSQTDVPSTAQSRESDLRAAAETTLPAGQVQFRVGAQSGRYVNPASGVVQPFFTSIPLPDLGFAWGITDRLQLSVPGLTYRFGNRGSEELLISGAFFAGYSSVEKFIWDPALHVDVRQWLGRRNAINVGVHVGGSFTQEGSRDQVSASYILGFSHHFDSVTLNFSAWYAQRVFRGPRYIANYDDIDRSGQIAFGGSQTLGLRSLPLAQFHLGPTFSLYADAMVSFDAHLQNPGGRVAAGASWTF